MLWRRRIRWHKVDYLSRRAETDPEYFLWQGSESSGLCEEDFCFIDPTDRFAVCCPNENNDLKEEQEAATSSAVIVKGCTSIVMLWPLISYYY